MRLLKSLLALLLVIAVIVIGLLFSMENTATVPLSILVTDLPEQRISTWILLSFFLGGCLGLLSSTLVILRLQASRIALRRSLEQSARKAATEKRG
ncbi:MAG: LapA family protein [Spongiibacter sp.]|uniref:LapA family protein n=1 Tax=Spongiibacter thalassae TaxID=2721624 RepID=A0ABX1GD64_9GAMM|nr:LapA family protein [Spongiibacter thalassae]NKI16871.1 LapA family protein [Spongiibacter thalassae]